MVMLAHRVYEQTAEMGFTCSNPPPFIWVRAAPHCQPQPGTQAAPVPAPNVQRESDALPKSVTKLRENDQTNLPRQTSLNMDKDSWNNIDTFFSMLFSVLTPFGLFKGRCGL